MSLYIVLMKFTQKGIESIRDQPQRYKEYQQAAEKFGCKILGHYYTMGNYDMVVIAEAPNDEVVMKIALLIGSRGNFRTETLKAVSAEAMAELVKGLPS